MATEKTIFIYIAVSIVVASILVILIGFIWLRKRKWKQLHLRGRQHSDKSPNPKRQNIRGSGSNFGAEHDRKFRGRVGTCDNSNLHGRLEEAILRISSTPLHDSPSQLASSRVNGGFPLSPAISQSRSTYPHSHVQHPGQHTMPSPPAPAYPPHRGPSPNALSGRERGTRTPNILTELPPQPPPKTVAVLSPVSPDTGGSLGSRISTMNSSVSPIDSTEPPTFVVSYFTRSCTKKKATAKTPCVLTQSSEKTSEAVVCTQKEATAVYPTALLPPSTQSPVRLGSSSKPAPSQLLPIAISGRGNLNNGSTSDLNKPLPATIRTPDDYVTSYWDAAELQRRRRLRGQIQSVTGTTKSTATNTTTVSTILGFSEDEPEMKWTLDRDGRWVGSENKKGEECATISNIPPRQYTHKSQWDERPPPMPPLPPLSSLPRSQVSTGIVRRKPAPLPAMPLKASRASRAMGNALYNRANVVTDTENMPRNNTLDTFSSDFVAVCKDGELGFKGSTTRAQQRMRSYTSPPTYALPPLPTERMKSSLDGHIHHLSSSTLLTSGGVLFSDEETQEDGEDGRQSRHLDDVEENVHRHVGIKDAGGRKVTHGYCPQLELICKPNEARDGRDGREKRLYSMVAGPTDHTPQESTSRTYFPYSLEAESEASQRSLGFGMDYNSVPDPVISLSRSSSLCVELGPSRSGTVGAQGRYNGG